MTRYGRKQRNEKLVPPISVRLEADAACSQMCNCNHIHSDRCVE